MSRRYYLKLINWRLFVPDGTVKASESNIAHARSFHPFSEEGAIRWGDLG
jgi:hypothetical protein